MENDIKTENRLATMEQKLDNLIDGVEKVNVNVEKVDLKLEKHVILEAEMYEKLDNKYSAKWVEKTLLVVIGVIFSGLLGAALKIILK